MKVSYKHLKQLIDFPYSPKDLAFKLTNLGLEVKGMENFGKLEKVIVGKILSIEDHPNADRLKVVKLDIGKKKISLVCGAPNIQEGIFVPVALEGAELRGGVRVREVKVRGVASPAMICSEDELDLGKNQSKVMVLSSHSSPGISVAEALDLDDIIFDLEITSNRGDCLSVIGVAREIAALLGGKLNLPSCVIENTVFRKDGIRIQIEDFDLCPYYGARVIRNAKVAPSPLWLRKKILISGGKPINNVVDATNYVMWEMGQPLHPFDYRLLKGRQIIVRRAKRGENLITLDGVERKLREDMLVIADAEKAVALAGIMGGEETQVDSFTKDILLESAYFNPSSIRQTSKKLGLGTEASFRFEKGVDPFGVKRALDRASLLIQKITGGEVEDPPQEEGDLPQRKKWALFCPSRVNRILGSRISSDKIKKLITQLGFQVKEEGEKWKVDIPSFRQDIYREIDLIGEVSRIYGYDRIGTTLPSLGKEEERESNEEKVKDSIKQLLIGFGFHEVVTSSLVGEDAFKKTDLFYQEQVKVRNPLSSQQQILRAYLFPQLLEAASHNVNQEVKKLRIFEVGKVFSNKEDGFQEKTFLAGLILEEGFDFFSLKGIGEALLKVLKIKKVEFGSCSYPYFSSGETALIKKDGVALGVMGRVNDRIVQNFKLPGQVYIFEWDFSSLFPFWTGKKRFYPLPKFPSVQRDLAIVLKEDISAQKVKEEILREGIYLENVEFFDVYQGQPIPFGYKSLAFRLTFRHPERTLRDEEVNEIQDTLLNGLEKKWGVYLRKEWGENSTEK